MLILFRPGVIIMLLRILQKQMKCYYVVLAVCVLCARVCVRGWLLSAQYIDEIIDNGS